MLTKADDFPIHQLPEPIAYSGTDRNFYDRYFFNGYSRSSDVFFAAALGVYPHLNIMDAQTSASEVRPMVTEMAPGPARLGMARGVKETSAF